MRIGIDLGGTKIELAAFAEECREIFRKRIPAPRGSYDATLKALRTLVEAAERETGQRGSVGIGTPGAISPATGLLKNSNSTWLNGRPFHRDLEGALDREVRIANDANCFALSEAIDGAGRGARVVFGVIVGTGTGGGIVVDRKVLTGPNAIAGEWGHNPLPWPNDDERPGPPCYCGKCGCIEVFLSGPGLSLDHRSAAGISLEAPAVAERASSGDPAAQSTLDRYADRMARALSSVVNVLDPDVIVLGGGMSNLAFLYQAVPSLWGRYVFSDRVDTRLLPPVHGDAGGVRGAAWLWDEDPA